MNNYDYLLNNYNRAFSMNDFNMLNQSDLLPKQNMNMPQNPASMNMPNPNFNLYTPQEAYDKGNLFANLYKQYKNYRPATLRANNERERMFLEFSRMAFAANRAEMLKEEYEKKYGPLTVSSSNDTTPFQWVKESWPWEGEF